MNSPEFDFSPYPRGEAPPPPPVPETRNKVGWVLLFIIFTFLVGKEFAQYIDRGEPNSNSKYSGIASQLQTAVKLKQTFSNLGSKRMGSDLPILQVEEELAPESSKNEIAARIFAAARSEQGKEIPAPVLAKLNASKEPKDKLFAEIFSAKEVTLQRAKELEAELKGGGFISKLATIQAFEKAGDPSRREALVSRNRSYAQIGLMVVALLVGGTGFFLLITYCVMKLSKQLPNKGFPLQNISLADADRLALRTAQILAVFLAIPIVMEALVLISGKAIPGKLASFVTYLFLIIGTLQLFRLPINGKTISLESIGITKHNLGKNIAWGIGMAIANLPLVLIMGMLGNLIFSWLPKAEHPLTNQIAGGGVGIWTLAIMLFAASVTAPIVEEIMFRGTLLPALARVWGKPVLAIIVQGFIFAAIHPTGIPAWFALGTIGAMSGVLSRQTGSLVPSIVMHAVHNFGTMAIAVTMLG